MSKPVQSPPREKCRVAWSRLNAICPYFTMFPLDFPLDVLAANARDGEWVLDPFCGRGTTNFAARLLGLPTIGIDSSPVAVALSQAKLVSTSVAEIMAVARRILDETPDPEDVPSGEFWELAYHGRVLRDLCRIREGLQRDSNSPARIALRAIILGALHGPQSKSGLSYFSNQAPRTYAPKPAYSVRFWREHSLLPKEVDVLEVIRIRAQRYYGEPLPEARGRILFGDSRDPVVKSSLLGVLGTHTRGFSWVITSPPYYGMRTYIPDQWLRNWFLGGPPTVDYSCTGQLSHSSVEGFCQELNDVWRTIEETSNPDAALIVRFGCINSKKIDPREIIERSLCGTGWSIRRITPAGVARKGRRQANHFSRVPPAPPLEFDVYACLSRGGSA